MVTVEKKKEGYYCGFAHLVVRSRMKTETGVLPQWKYMVTQPEESVKEGGGEQEGESER